VPRLVIAELPVISTKPEVPEAPMSTVDPDGKSLPFANSLAVAAWIALRLSSSPAPIAVESVGWFADSVVFHDTTEAVMSAIRFALVGVVVSLSGCVMGPDGRTDYERSMMDTSPLPMPAVVVTPPAPRQPVHCTTSTVGGVYENTNCY
jgi:hypothetical protein